MLHGAIAFPHTPATSSTWMSTASPRPHRHRCDSGCRRDCRDQAAAKASPRALLGDYSTLIFRSRTTRSHFARPSRAILRTARRRGQRSSFARRYSLNAALCATCSAATSYARSRPPACPQARAGHDEICLSAGQSELGHRRHVRQVGECAAAKSRRARATLLPRNLGSIEAASPRGIHAAAITSAYAPVTPL